MGLEIHFHCILLCLFRATFLEKLPLYAFSFSSPSTHALTHSSLASVPLFYKRIFTKAINDRPENNLIEKC